MSSMKRIDTRAILLCIVAACTTTCASLDVRSRAEDNFSISRYRTFGWHPDSWIRDPNAGELVRKHLSIGLNQLGLTHSETPDLLVRHYGRSGEQVTTEIHNYDWFVSVGVHSTTVGTLIVELVDAKSGETLFLGAVSGVADEVMRNSNRGREKVAQAVAELVKTIPR